jgi:hypothetical protein
MGLNGATHQNPHWSRRPEFSFEPFLANGFLFPPSGMIQCRQSKETGNDAQRPDRCNDYYPGADSSWAWGAGAGGTYTLWNRRNGIVFAGVGIHTRPTSDGIPHVIEANIAASNPLLKAPE